jgi:CxxC-x17-CxxC domain-containing protein
MGDFKRNRSGKRNESRKDFGSFQDKRSKRPDRRDRGSRTEMHEVVCDKCGKECEVPFKPTSNKPIYCSDCFRKEDGGSSNRSSPRPSKELEEINKKLDKIIKHLKIE